MTWNEFKARLGKIAGFVVAVLIVNFVLMPFGLGIRSFTDVPRTPWLIRFYPVQAHRPVQDRINKAFEGTGLSVMHVPTIGHTYVLALPKSLAGKMARPYENLNGLHPRIATATNYTKRSDVTQLEIPREFLVAIIVDARLNDPEATKSLLWSNTLTGDDYSSPNGFANTMTGKQEIYLLWSNPNWREALQPVFDLLKFDGAAQTSVLPGVPGAPRDWEEYNRTAVILPSDDGNNRFGVIEGKIIRNADRFDL